MNIKCRSQCPVHFLIYLLCNATIDLARRDFSEILPGVLFKATVNLAFFFTITICYIMQQ
jgi:hypothetical protein